MSEDALHVPWSRHFISSLVHRTRWFWCWLGNVETWYLKEELKPIRIERPITITGLARAGSTILLEIIASHPDVGTHQYRDFPFLYIPYWWRSTLERSETEVEPAERAHKDRLLVTPQSPEAMEEVLWMAFFDHLHDPEQSNVLDATTSNERFERFYRSHIRKLLLVMERTRYAAKGNYNVTRLEYLLKLFPDARFVVPIRRPQNHIASSQKQHRLFLEAGQTHPRAIAHLNHVGHYEFGPHRRPIHAGDDEVAASIRNLWQEGEEVRGWARYWAHLYGYLADRLRANPALRQATRLVRYEDLCKDTTRILTDLFEHCGLDDPEAIIDRYAETIRPPRYYSPDFTEEEETLILEETADVRETYGYGDRDVYPEMPIASGTGDTE